jgi:hypothetical protein
MSTGVVTFGTLLAAEDEEVAVLPPPVVGVGEPPVLDEHPASNSRPTAAVPVPILTTADRTTDPLRRTRSVAGHGIG